MPHVEAPNSWWPSTVAMPDGYAGFPTYGASGMLSGSRAVLSAAAREIIGSTAFSRFNVCTSVIGDVLAFAVMRFSHLLQDALLTKVADAAPYASQMLLKVTALLDNANSRGGGASSAPAVTRPIRNATLSATPSASRVQVRGSSSGRVITHLSSYA